MSEEKKKALLKDAKTVKFKNVTGIRYSHIIEVTSDKLILNEEWYYLKNITILEIDGKPLNNELDEIALKYFNKKFDNLNNDMNGKEGMIYQKHYCLKQLESRLNGGKLTDTHLKGLFDFNSAELKEKFISIVGEERLINFLKEYQNIGY